MVSVAAGARQIYATFLPWNVAADRQAVNVCAASTTSDWAARIASKVGAWTSFHSSWASCRREPQL